MKRKAICSLLCIFILLSLIGCGNGEPAKTESTTTTQSTTAPPASSEATTITTIEEIPAVDLTGYEFRLAGYFAEKFNPVPGRSERDDRWAREILQMQDNHGFSYVYIPFDPGLENVTSHLMVGDDICDFLIQRHCDIYIHAVNGRVKPLDGEELTKAGFNVYDEETWDVVYNRMLKFNDNIWGATVNGEYYLACFGDVLCFNPVLTDDMGYSAADIYNLVRNKQWTWEKYLEIARLVARDTTGDGQNDLWGTGAGIFQFGEMLVSNGYSPIYRDESGKWVADLMDYRYQNALDFLLQATSLDIRDSSLGTSGGPFKDSFGEGKTAFNQFYGWNFWEPPLDSTEFPFGVIPTPLGKDADDYISVMPEVDCWTMLVTNKNVEKSVACMNLWGNIMTNDGWKTRTQTECFRDEESWEMFENHIYPNTVLNMQQATEQTWAYIRDNIVKAVLVDRMSASAASEGHNAALQAILDDMLNK